MLLVTGKGHYFTVVEHKDDPELLLVRSQERESVEHVIETLPATGLELIDEPDWDYRFRVILTRPEFQKYLELTVDEIDYPKVKPAVATARGASHPISKMVNEVFYYMSENRPDGSLPAWLGGRTATTSWADGLADWDEASAPVDEFKSDIDRVTRATEQALEDATSSPELAAELGLDADELRVVLERLRKEKA